jgi:hypothetical protein
MADINNKVKPINSAPILKATSSEYTMAVKTPNHSSDFCKFMN